MLYLPIPGSVCVCVRMCACTQSCLTLCDPVEPARLICPWDSSGKNTGVVCHFLLQRIFPDPGIEPMSPALAGEF